MSIIAGSGELHLWQIGTIQKVDWVECASCKEKQTKAVWSWQSRGAKFPNALKQYAFCYPERCNFTWYCEGCLKRAGYLW